MTDLQPTSPVPASSMPASSVPASALTVERHLQSVLQTSQLQVLDESAAHAGHAGNPDGSGVGTHLRVRIASPLFTGKSRVAQHRLVYDACQAFIAQGLHALAIEIVPSSSAV